MRPSTTVYSPLDLSLFLGQHLRDSFLVRSVSLLVLGSGPRPRLGPDKSSGFLWVPPTSGSFSLTHPPSLLRLVTSHPEGAKLRNVCRESQRLGVRVVENDSSVAWWVGVLSKLLNYSASYVLLVVSRVGRRPYVVSREALPFRTLSHYRFPTPGPTPRALGR